MNASVGRIDTRDIDEFQQYVAPWEVILRQTSPGVFLGRTEYLQVNGILLYRERCSHRFIATGASPEGFFMFGGPASPRTHVNWCGTELNARCLAFGRPSSEVDFVIPTDSYHLVLLVPNRMLERYLGEELAAALLKRRQFLACQPSCSNQLLDLIDRLVEKYLFHGELLSDERICNAIEWQLLGGIVEFLVSGGTDAGCVSPGVRYLAVRRAIEYFEVQSQPISVPELAAVAGVSERVLELGFQETTGTTPRDFMRWDRMNRARRDLLVAESASFTVTKIAARYGINELGRFAVDYKRIFGESPSTTLKRSVRSHPKRLADTLLESTHR